MSQGKQDRQQDEVGKMFVGGLSWKTTQESLHIYFSKYGEVVDCVVMKNPETGKSRGFGFVTYKDPSCLETVLSIQPHLLDDKQIDPKACNPRGSQKKTSHVTKGKKIFVGGLAPTASENDLREFFSKYGNVTEVSIMYDQQKQRSRGFGFVSFDSEEAVENTVAEHYININGKQAEIKRAEPQSGRGDGGGRGGGGGGGGGRSFNNMGTWNQSNGNGQMGGGMPQGWGGGPQGGGWGQQGFMPQGQWGQQQFGGQWGQGFPQQQPFMPNQGAGGAGGMGQGFGQFPQQNPQQQAAMYSQQPSGNWTQPQQMVPQGQSMPAQMPSQMGQMPPNTNFDYNYAQPGFQGNMPGMATPGGGPQGDSPVVSQTPPTQVYQSPQGMPAQQTTPAGYTRDPRVSQSNSTPSFHPYRRQ
ncbi:PREDICTED: DAZ-associated protein 1-like isoform X2 [Priapulus caudatus]|uniref:DAZ-associated protein 1-like isoform X2 n=1 Tax=Priapulus caudatus TaxID=37621 RepID=A0ABM1DU49_PRICU|nr:PREDICTED: DAZ-associated protein 1-like isoform X2 [Priapulus caudatus]